MKSVIHKILLEETDKKSYYGRYLNNRFAQTIINEAEKHYNWDYVFGMISELSDKYAIEEEFIKIIIFKHLIDENDEIYNYGNLDEWLYKVSNPVSFLKESGYYYTIDVSSFGDVIKDGESYKLVTSGWYDFAELFDNSTLAETVLDEDWADLYDAWNTPIGELFDDLDEKGIQEIQNFIIENVDEIVEIGHREEFDDMTDENGVINVKTNINNIKNVTDNYNLQLLVEEGYFEERDDLIRNLRGAYNMGYNTAAEDELFTSLKEEIEEFCGSEGEWSGSDLIFDITSTYQQYMDEYLNDVELDPTTEHGDYLDMVRWWFSQFRISNQHLQTPDSQYFYPDGNKVRKYYNEQVAEYIYM